MRRCENPVAGLCPLDQKHSEGAPEVGTRYPPALADSREPAVCHTAPFSVDQNPGLTSAKKMPRSRAASPER